MNKGFKQFLWKTGIFAGLFIIFSVIIGSQLYQYGLLEKWKIEIYGRIGYILLFSIAGFVLFYRERLLKFKKFQYRKLDLIFFIKSFILLALFYLFETNAYKFSINTINLILIHLIGIFIFIFLWFGVYGWDFTRNFIKEFKKELVYFLIFGIIVYTLMNAVWSLWPYLSLIVMEIVSFLLKIINNNVSIINLNTIVFEGFAAQIAEACSGIYSIFIFSSLYIFGVLLDWKKMNKTKAVLMFIPAVIGAFFANILRVFLLFIAGAYISKELALGLYHSYVGMIFFLIYFGLFWGLTYKWMKK